MQATAHLCSSVDCTASLLGQTSQLTAAPRASTTTVPDSYTLRSLLHPHFHKQVLDWRCLVTSLPHGCKGDWESAFSSLYLAKPH